MWTEQVGAVSVIGMHPPLCPFYTERSHPEIYADPFMMSSVKLLLDGSVEEIGGLIILSFRDDCKAEIAFDDEIEHEYRAWYPNPKIECLWSKATFAGYLRKNFAWGGLPGAGTGLSPRGMAASLAQQVRKPGDGSGAYRFEGALCSARGRWWTA